MNTCTGFGFWGTLAEANGSIAPASPISLMSGPMQAESATAGERERQARGAQGAETQCRHGGKACRRKEAIFAGSDPTAREAAFIQVHLRFR